MFENIDIACSNCLDYQKGYCLVHNKEVENDHWCFDYTDKDSYTEFE